MSRNRAVSRVVLGKLLVAIVIIFPLSDQSYLLHGKKCFLNASDLQKAAV